MTTPGSPPPPCRVRPAGAGDLVAVLAVHARRDPGGGAAPAPSPRQRAAWDHMMRSPDVTVYLAEAGDRPVGTATLTVVPNVAYRDGAPSALVEAVVVAYDHRRRGWPPPS